MRVAIREELHQLLHFCQLLFTGTSFLTWRCMNQVEVKRVLWNGSVYIESLCASQQYCRTWCQYRLLLFLLILNFCLYPDQFVKHRQNKPMKGWTLDNTYQNVLPMRYGMAPHPLFMAHWLVRSVHTSAVWYKWVLKQPDTPKTDILTLGELRWHGNTEIQGWQSFSFLIEKHDFKEVVSVLLFLYPHFTSLNNFLFSL